jgi:hypothetical protein
MLNTLLDKLQQLKDRFVGGRADAQDVVAIDGWITEAKRLLLLQSLAKHDGIKYVLQIFESEVEKINAMLLGSDSKSLPDRERDRLLDRRDLAQKYLDLFKPVESDLEKLEEIVDKEVV